jgi:hypothetical protein
MIIPRFDRALKHRVRGSLLVPFIELDLTPQLADRLEAVIVGTITHKEQTAEAIKEPLKSKGFPSIEVRCSERHIDASESEEFSKSFGAGAGSPPGQSGDRLRRLSFKYS